MSRDENNNHRTSPRCSQCLVPLSNGIEVSRYFGLIALGKLTGSMAALDYLAFPHIFDAVLDHLVAAKNVDTLRTVYRLSRAARDRVFRKCCHHLSIDYRAYPVTVGTALGGFWIPDHQFSPGSTVVDIYAGEDYSMYPLAPDILRIITQTAPQTIRLLDHYGMDDVLSYSEPINTLVFHTKNWCLNREPDPWFLMLPANAERIIINLIGCDEFGYPDVSFAPAHNHDDVQQELVLIATAGPSPPPDAEGVVNRQHHLIDNITYSILGYLEELQQATITVVGAEHWKHDWSCGLPPPDMQPSNVGQHLITCALTETCRESTYDAATGSYVQHSDEVVEAFLQRIKFIALDEFKESVGDTLFELMTVEAV